MPDHSTLQITFLLQGLHGVAVVHGIEGTETVSRAYSYEVVFSAPEVMIEDARGSLARIVLEDPLGNVRLVSGVVVSISVLANGADDLPRFRARLIPKPALVSYRHGFRIFQDKSVPEIVKQVFHDAGISDAYFRWPDGIDDRYPKRTFCAQYDETEWDFVCRLLEEEGIWFGWEHALEPLDDGAHVMVLGEKSENAAHTEPDSVVFADRGTVATSKIIAWSWISEARAVPKVVALDDYDMERPSNELDAGFTAAQLPGGAGEDALPSREWYEYPGRYVDLTVGKRLARTRLEELRSAHRSAVFETNGIFVQTGRLIELQNHPFASGWYFVTSLHLSVAMEDIGDQQESAWQVHVQVVPKTQTYRPPRATPRPQIPSMHTALVTGPPGEEIHCDDLGRIKLQMHWDRNRTLDDKTSCWIRVAQGHTTGSVMIPRVGWEVLVEHIDGDVDRPLCMGRLYNPLAMPDYSLPTDKTVSGIRSNSSPGAGGVNEVHFDDSAGNEQFFVNCPKDILFNVENNETHKVVNNQDRSTGANSTHKVGAKETIAVKGNQSGNVTGSHTVTVSGSRTLKTSESSIEEITGDTTVTVGGMENVKVGNPATAVLEIIASEAVSAATGAVAGAASRAQGALLGPIAPALNAAKGVLGGAASLAGPAAAMFGGGSPVGAVFGTAAGSLSNMAGAADAGNMAAGMASAALGPAATDLAVAATGAAGAGVWATTAGADVKETIGALCAHNSAYGAMYGVGASCKETIGAARIGIYTGGYAETVGAAKTEKVGIYKVNASDGITVDAKGAIAITVAKQTQKIGKTHALSAKNLGALTTSKLDFKGATSITLKCGTAEVVIDSSGITLKGVSGTTIEGTSKLELSACNLKPA